MAGDAGALGPLCRGEAPITRAGLGDARRASPKSGRPGPNLTGPEARQTLNHCHNIS